jgi:hypothetical protein
MTMRKIALLTGVLLVVGVVVAWSRFRGHLDGLERRAVEIAGSDSVDCGRVPPGGDRGVADACAVAAFRARRAFRGRYDVQGIDSTLSAGLVGDLKGEVHVISFDSDIHGGSFLFRRESVVVDICPSPEIVQVGGKERLKCEAGLYRKVA